MKARLVILGIDDILRLFKDYTGLTGSIPEDAKVDTLLFNKQLMKMCLRISSESLDHDQPPEGITFQLKRTWAVN